MASYKDLSSATMVHITGAWVDVARARPHLEKMKRVAPLLEDVESGHEGLVQAHRKEDATGDAIAAIQAQQLGFDHTHDRKARGSFGILGAFVELADTPEQAATYQRALDTLFSDGMRIVTATYAEEAGHTRLVRDRLTADIKATLKAIPSPDGNLLKTVLAWLDAGDALGALEERRAKLEASVARTREASRGGNLLRARNRWVNVVRAVTDMIELEEPVAAVRDEVLGPLERALAQSVRRHARSKTDGAAHENEAPVETPSAHIPSPPPA